MDLRCADFHAFHEPFLQAALEDALVEIRPRFITAAQR